jgi:drug/metabolite transporter (DMT)-like permease
VTPAFGIALKIASALAFTVMAALIKHVGDRYPVGEVVFFRSAFALFPLMAWLAARREVVASIRTTNFLGHARRSLAGSFGMFCNFTALALLPLPDATAIGYASPFFATALGAVVLKEHVRPYRWLAVILGFCGVLVMMVPHLRHGLLETGLSGGSALGAVVALTSAAFSGVASVEVRRLSHTERTGSIVFYFCTISASFGLMTILFGWVWPTASDAAALIGAGVVGGIGQILFSASFRHADVSVLAPFDYVSLIWALAIGLAIFGEWPAAEVLFGAGIVVGSGVFLVMRERRAVRQRRLASEPHPAE